MIGEVLAHLRHEGGERMRTALAGRDRLDPTEFAGPGDHGLFGPSSIAWRIHGESSMLIGGLRALLLQTLHPLVMAGVTDHSDYRRDPWGRLHRTGRFIGATTYGSTATAEQAIEMVRRVHDSVVGTTPDGRPYEANDPHLLLWVHVTEVDSFLSAYDRYGVGRLTNNERDRYVTEMAEIGRRLGVGDPPTDRHQLAASLRTFAGQCEYGRQAREAVRFLLVPPVVPGLRGPYRAIAAGAVGLLPPWAQSLLLLPVPPAVDRLAIRPAAAAVTRTLGWLMADLEERARDDRLLTVGPVSEPLAITP